MPRSKKSNRKDGRYEIKRTIGYTTDDKPIRKSFYGSTKDEADLRYHEYLLEIEKKKQQQQQTSFTEWAEKWMETYKKQDVRANSYETTYVRPYKLFIRPFFEGTILQNITQLDIKRLLNQISEKSQSTINKVLHFLRQMFEAAIDNEMIEKNPCRNVTCKSKQKSAKKRTYDKTSTDYLCSTNHPYSLFVHILLRMGLRCSELCGLRWEDIDLNAETLSVKQALTKESGIIYIDAPKSANSIRKLKIPEELLQRLRKHYGTGYITESKGKPLSPDYFRRFVLMKFYKDLGIPENLRLNPHELRHTCGTLLYEETRDVYHVSRFLGHCDINITTEIYVHSEMQDEKVSIF